MTQSAYESALNSAKSFIGNTGNALTSFGNNFMQSLQSGWNTIQKSGVIGINNPSKNVQSYMDAANKIANSKPVQSIIQRGKVGPSGVSSTYQPLFQTPLANAKPINWGQTIGNFPIGAIVDPTSKTTVNDVVSNFNKFDARTYNPSIPEVTLPKVAAPYEWYMPGSIYSEIAKLPSNIANAAIGMTEGTLNIPRKFMTGSVNLFQDIIDKSQGKQIRPQDAAAHLAQTAELPVFLATLGFGNRVVGEIEKKAFKQILGEAVTSGIGYGTVFGAIGGAESGQTINNPVDYVNNFVANAAIGAAMGVTLGVGGTLFFKGASILIKQGNKLVKATIKDFNSPEVQAIIHDQSGKIGFGDKVSTLGGEDLTKKNKPSTIIPGPQDPLEKMLADSNKEDKFMVDTGLVKPETGNVSTKVPTPETFSTDKPLPQNTYYHQTDAPPFNKFNSKEIWVAPDDTAYYGDRTMVVQGAMTKPFIMSDLEIPRVEAEKNTKLYESFGGEANPKTFDKLRQMGYDSIIEQNGDRAFLYPDRVQILSQDIHQPDVAQPTSQTGGVSTKIPAGGGTPTIGVTIDMNGTPYEVKQVFTNGAGTQSVTLANKLTGVESTRPLTDLPVQPTNLVSTKLHPQEPPIVSVGKKVRGFPQTVIDTAGLPKEIKDWAKTLTYDQLPNRVVLDEVAQIIKKGDAQAINFAKTNETVTGNATAMVMLSKLIDEGRLSEVNDLLSAVSPRFTKQGQSTQILSQWSRLQPTGAIRWAQRLVDEVNKANPRANLKLTEQNIEIITNRAKAIQTMQDGTRGKMVATAELIRDIQSVVPVSWGQRISAIQTFSQLLNPKTLIRNTGGNFLFAAMENAMDVFATGIDMGVSVFTGKRSKVLPDLMVQTRGAWRGLSEGTQDAWKGINTAEGINTQYELPHITFTGKWNPLTYVEKLLNIGLRATDRAAFQAGYDGSLNNQMRAARVKTPTPQMIETAFGDGKYRTFQDDSTLAKLFVGTKKLLNKIGTPDGKFGLGDLILKYPKTPANLLSRGLDYSPVGFFKGLYLGVRPLLTGRPFEQKQFVEALSRGLLGTGTLAVGYTLAKFGIMSGRPTKDYDIAAMQREQGTGPFRINTDALQRYFLTGQPQTPQTGDNVVSFDWAQPASLPFAMGANLFINPKGNDQLTAAIEQLDAGASTLTQQSLFQGITGFSSDITRYDPIRAVSNVVLAAPSGFVSTFSNQLVQIGDNTSRETYDPSILKQAYNKVTARIPGLESQLPPKIGVLGKPLERYQNGGNNFFNVFLNPSFVSKISANPSAKEVLDMFIRSGETQQAPRLVDKKITINGQQIVLTSEQLGQYQAYVGQRADQAIQTIKNDPIYLRATDEAKAQLISNILSDINSAAKIEIFGNQPKSVGKSVTNIINGTFAPQGKDLGGGITFIKGSDNQNSMGVTLTKDGNLTLTNISGTLPTFKPTGIMELDKEAISAFNSEIESKINGIYDLYKVGKLTKEYAGFKITSLRELTLKMDKYGRITQGTQAGTSSKKVSIKAPTALKLSKVKFSTPKAIKPLKLSPIKVAKAPKVSTAKFASFNPKKINTKIKLATKLGTGRRVKIA